MQLKQTIKAAFPHTIPVMTGYLVLGFAFGILLQNAGYNAVWAALMSVTIYAGSMQYVAVDLLSQAFSLTNAFILTLMVNARHIFYGFSMLEKFRGTRKFKPYLIFSMTDETFTLLYSIKTPTQVNRSLFYFCIAVMDHLYWIAGGIIGALAGAQLHLNIKGIEFVMTALFVSIFTEQVREKQNRIPGIIGIVGSVLSLVLFGPAHFLLAAMVMLVFALTLMRAPIERGIGA